MEPNQPVNNLNPGGTIPPFVAQNSPEQVATPLPSTPLPQQPSISNVPLGDGAVDASIQTPPSPKRGLPKILIIIPILIFLALIGFLVFRLVSGSGILPKGQVDLTWWGLWEDESVIVPLIEEYQSQNPNVRVTYVNQSKQDYRERLLNALAQNKGPDIFRIHNTWTPMFRNELALLPEDIMSASEFNSVFYSVASRDLTSGSGVSGIPLMYDGLGLFINEEIFNTYGKTPPKTWDEFREIAFDLTIKDEGGIIKQAGAALGRTENVDHWPEILSLMMIQNGANMASLNDEPAFGAVSYFTLFSGRSGVWDETLPTSTIAFAGGKLAMYFGPSWRAFEILEQNPNLNFRVVPVPQLPKLDPSEPDVTLATYWFEAVWDKSPNKREAWNFLKFVSSRESLEKLYANSAKLRAFGEPYPRIDMRDLLVGDPYVSGIVSLAQSARSSYFSSRTFDGPTGINSQLIKYLEDAINAINQGRGGDIGPIMQTATTGIQQVLATYGLIAPPATPSGN